VSGRSSIGGGGYEPTGRDFSLLFEHWGSLPDNLRAILNLAIPTVTVSRFRDDFEGSLWGIAVGTGGAANEFPAVALGSSTNAWEIHSIFCQNTGVAVGSVMRSRAHIFTPVFPYNPVLNLNPVGFFVPGFITNRAFSFGSVRGLAGTNPLFPAIQGPQFRGEGITNGAINDTSVSMDERFDPPLRIKQDQTFAIQGLSTNVFAAGMAVSILYNELPPARL